MLVIPENRGMTLAALASGLRPGVVSVTPIRHSPCVTLVGIDIDGRFGSVWNSDHRAWIIRHPRAIHHVMRIVNAYADGNLDCIRFYANNPQFNWRQTLLS
jgi:hypothetical protein